MIAPDTDRPRFDPTSLVTRTTLATATTSSLGAGWSSMLVERRTVPAGVREFETRPTTDLCLVLRLSGRRRIESRRRGQWHGAVYPLGSVAVTAEGESNRLRYACRTPWVVGHFFVPGATVEDAVEFLRPVGASAAKVHWDALHVKDHLLATTCRQLLRAVDGHYSDLYAAQAAQWLAVHMLTVHGHGLEVGRRTSGRLSDARLSRTIELIRSCFAEPLSLDRLAAEAGVSKFHFVRVFRLQTGLTPAKYVERVRSAEVARLLRSTDLYLADIAARTGFAGPDQLTAAFKRVFGDPPRTYRRSLFGDEQD